MKRIIVELYLHCKLSFVTKKVLLNGLKELSGF